MFPNCCLFVSCKNTLSSLFIHIWYYHLNCYTATGILWVMGPTAFTSPDAFLLPNIVWVNSGAQLNVSIPPYIDVEPMNTRPAVGHASTCSTTAPILHNDADMFFFSVVYCVLDYQNSPVFPSQLSWSLPKHLYYLLWSSKKFSSIICKKRKNIIWTLWLNHLKMGTRKIPMKMIAVGVIFTTSPTCADWYLNAWMLAPYTQHA